MAAHATAIAPSCVPVALSLSVLGAGIALGIAGAMFEVMLNVLYGSVCLAAAAATGRLWRICRRSVLARAQRVPPCSFRVWLYFSPGWPSDLCCVLLSGALLWVMLFSRSCVWMARWFARACFSGGCSCPLPWMLQPPAPNDNELCDYCSGFGTVPCELCLGVGSIRTPVSSLSFTTTTTSSSSSSSFTASSTPIYHELSTTSPSSSRPSTRVCPMCSGSRREACRPCAGSGFSGYKKGHRPFTRSIAERARSRVAEEGWIEGPVTSGRATASCEGREA